MTDDEISQATARSVANRLLGVEVEYFKDLIGFTFTDVRSNHDTMQFTRSDGRKFMFHHHNDCCENVYIESIVGDLADLVGAPLVIAESVTHEDETPADVDGIHEPVGDSYTWTFYKFATLKGFVDVRWLGESNGYYSESVSFDEVSP